MTKPISRKMAVDCLLGLYRVVCGICLEPLSPGDNVQFDHIHAHIFNGPHEPRNLRPVHAQCHKQKTARDIAANAKVKRIQKGKQHKGRPLPGTKASGWKKSMSGEVTRR